MPLGRGIELAEENHLTPGQRSGGDAVPIKHPVAGQRSNLWPRSENAGEVQRVRARYRAPSIGIRLPSDFAQRTDPSRSADAIVAEVNQRLGAIKDAYMFVLSPPPVSGLGNAGGFKLQLQDQASLGEGAMYGVVQQLMGRIYGDPASPITQFFSSYQINVPQLMANVDRAKLATRDQRNKDFIFDPQVDPVWSQVARLVGEEVATQLRQILRRAG